MLNIDELEELAARHGFRQPRVAAAVAMAESHVWGTNPPLANPAAKAIVTEPKPGFGPERSFGLWQINTLAHNKYDETLLLDPDYNAQAAFEISDGGNNWHPWTTFTSGAYRQYMPVPAPAPTPVSGLDFFDDEESDA